MHIGLTFDLKTDYLAQGFSAEDAAEFDSEDTIAAIETALISLGHRVTRIGGIKPFMRALCAGARFDVIFNICEGIWGLAREAQVPALAEAHGLPCTFADAATLALCLHKGWTKSVLVSAGVPTTPFMVIRHGAAGALEAMPQFDPPFFIKPVAEGTGKGVSPLSIIRTRYDLALRMQEMAAQYPLGVIIEPFLPGREFTVGLTGEGMLARAEGCIEVHLRESAEASVYSYTNKAEHSTRVTYRLATDAMADEAMRVALDAYRALGCRDAGRADLRADAQGRVMLMEMNPLAGLNPNDGDLPILWRLLGRDYTSLIGRIVEGAQARIGRKA